MYHKILLVAFTCILIFGCSSFNKTENIIGVYKITKNNCHGSTQQIDICKNIVFIELVNGHFYKISNNEIAFVVWSGMNDLTYVAKKYEGDPSVVNYPIMLSIAAESSYVENITFTSKGNGVYSFGNQSTLSTLEFSLATAEDITRYIKEYPGND
ncbi:hypothetical protein [Colwellia echini]|uniref:DUF2846 domain-containing protein n=1 Tax=Colwellia echini TaxID=1982103 RepID=A0ABY3MVD4_9GAMM|nr:hypothetical protein [Colwellia echini]TYK65017.1 hypothetical protein CWS31_012910 [Colwellia echini]